jgi:MFS family permease
VLMGVTVLSGMFGISYLGTGSNSATSLGFLLPELVAVGGLIAFVRHSARAEHPYIPIQLLRGRGFGAMNVINFLYGGAAMGISALIPLYAEDRYGIKILDAGTLLTARGIGMITVAALAAMAVRQTGYRMPMLVGFVVAAGGLALTAMAPHGLSPYAWLAVSSAVMGIGIGVATPAANNATLQLAPESAAGIAGLRGMFRQAGSITGLSVTTAIMARSDNPGLAEAHVFFVFAAVVLSVLLLIPLVPEHRGAW